MKNNYLYCAFVALCMAQACYAQTPLFQAFNLSITIPKNKATVLEDTNSIAVGSNYIYKVRGQFFTNGLDGQIVASIASNSDKSSPWKTLSSLLACYHGGTSSNDLRSLYTEQSKGFINAIYTNSDSLARYTNFANSITNMTVVLGFETESNGYVAITEISGVGNSSVTQMPFFFSKQILPNSTNYFISEHENNTMEDNIIDCVSSQTASSCIKKE